MIITLAARIVALFLGLQIAALCTIAIVLLIPDESIVEELQTAIHSGIITNVDFPKSPTGGRSDGFMECISLSAGITTNEDYNGFERIAIMPNLNICSQIISNLEAYSNGETPNSFPKPWYWHGLSVISRPAIATVGVNGVRTLAVIMLGGAVFAVAQAVSSVRGKLAALALLGPFIMTSDILTFLLSFHHPMMLAVGLMGVAYLVRCAERNYGYADLSVHAFVMGSLYSFFNLLNFVPGLWVMVVAVVGGCTPYNLNPAERLRRMSAVCVAWLTGYISMWAGKWMWAAIGTSWSDIKDIIIQKLRFRINGAGDPTYTYGFAEGFNRNIDYWLDQPFASFVLVCAVVMIILCLTRRRKLQLIDLAVLSIPVLIFVPSVLISNNFHAIHAPFEFRSLPMAVGAVLFLLYVISNRTPELVSNSEEVIASNHR